MPRQRAGGSGGRGRPGPARPRFTSRAAVLVLVLAVLMVSYASSLRAYLDQRRHTADLRAEISSSEANIASLEREKKRWKDPAYVSSVAHRRFGWVMPGETGFQVIGEDGKPLGHQDSLDDPNAVTESNRPLWWQSAWGSVVEAGKPESETEDVPPPVSRIRPPSGSTN